jgi:hypothetical protein
LGQWEDGKNWIVIDIDLYTIVIPNSPKRFSSPWNIETKAQGPGRCRCHCFHVYKGVEQGLYCTLCVPPREVKTRVTCLELYRLSLNMF